MVVAVVAQPSRHSNQACFKKSRRRYLLQRIVSELESHVAEQLDAILHHPQFQQLEASWRSLHALTNIANDQGLYASIDGPDLLQIKILNLAWEEVGQDLERVHDVDQSQLFRLVYSDGLDTPGAHPFSVLIGDYRISHDFHTNPKVNDVDTLRSLSCIASAGLCPFITGVDKHLFDLTRWENFALEPERLEKLFRGRNYTDWNHLRQFDESRFLGLTFPDILLRPPHDVYIQDMRFRYQERQIQADQDYLWGNSAYAYASTLMKTFAETGWFVNLSRGQPNVFFEADHDSEIDQRLQTHLPFDTDPQCLDPRPNTSVQLTHISERILAQLGFIPLSSRHGREESRFYYSPSLHWPKHYSDSTANTNARLAGALPYTFGTSRIGHHLKVNGRNQIGNFVTAADIQKLFSDYLKHYTTRNAEGLSSLRLKKPLADYQVKIQPRLGQSGSFDGIVHLQPHGQCDQIISKIRLVTQMNLNPSSPGGTQ